MLKAIAKELVFRKSEITDQVGTIYFGGGTPSLLNQEEIDRIVELVDEHYDLVHDPEITLEANPDDLTK
jgi:oxygen-independent coproporphyrinogen-3 oxidase